ncbi:MAG: hypothetical protein WDM89_10025 [Rhizomicrobium sp.]
MIAPSPSNPKVLIGASIPRSGHHFLANMMTGYYGSDLYYCEYYTLPSCCRSAPCTRRGQHKIIYQKSHDRDFALPADISDALYLIQYRHPVPEALSDRELELQETLGRVPLAYRQTRESYVNWLAGKAVYYRKFHDKWIANKLPNAMYLDYNALAGDPATLLEEIIGRTTGLADAQRLNAVVEKNRSPRSKTGFKPRVSEDSPYFDKDLLGAFEAWVLERCPRFGFAPEIGGSYAGSELLGLILLRDAEEPLPKGETKRLKATATLAPGHPEVLRRLAARAFREGRVPEAVKRSLKLIVAHPYYPSGYELLFRACKEAEKDIPETVLTGNAIVACSESAELSLQLGAAFGQKGLWINAIASYAIAMALEPANREAAERHAAALKEAK